MDGGYRRSKEVNTLGSPIEVKAFGSMGSTRIIQGSTLDGVPLHHHLQQEQQHKILMAMNQLYQTEQQRLTMLQQLMQQEQKALLRQSNCQQGNHHGALFMGQAGRGDGEGSANRNNTSGFTDCLTSLLGRNHSIIMNDDRFTSGIHSTNQEFMPYRPIHNRLGMDFILGTLSTASNVSDNLFKEKHDANREMSQSITQSVCHNLHTTGRAEDERKAFDNRFREKFAQSFTP